MYKLFLALALIFSFFALSIYDISYASNACTLFGCNNVDDNLKWWWNDLVSTVDNIAGYLIWLLYFIAVMIWIYWWFLVLTSWWEEDKVKKWRNYVIYMVLWLIIIFLASQIVHWVINVMTDTKVVWT